MEMSGEAMELVLLDKDELIASLRMQTLFWAEQYSDARAELYKLKKENARLAGMAHKAAEIILDPLKHAAPHRAPGRGTA